MAAEKSKMKNLTEGSPAKLIIGFAIPMFLGMLFQQFYSMVDTMIVGKFLGLKPLAGVGSTGSLNFMVIGFCIGVCNGFAIPVAQKFGAKDDSALRRFVANATWLCIGFAAVMTITASVFCRDILLFLRTPQNVFQYAYWYMLIIFLGIPCTFLYNFLAALIRSLGDSRTPVVFLAISSVLNIVLDLVFILVFRWGVIGAALATVLSQGISGVCCLFYVGRTFPILHGSRSEWKVQPRYMVRLCTIGIPMGLQYSITAIGSMVMQYANNSLDSVVYVSAFTAALRLKQFFMCPFDAIATGVSVFCSQNLGAGKKKRIVKGLFQGMAVAVGYGLCAGILLIFFGRDLCRIFISSRENKVLDAAAMYLFCQGFFFWSLGILNVSRMTTQGLGYSGRAVFSGVTEMVARIVVSLIFVPIYGYTAICFGDQTAWVSACIFIFPTCLICLKKVGANFRFRKVA